jgi:hypothetical protein
LLSRAERAIILSGIWLRFGAVLPLVIYIFARARSRALRPSLQLRRRFI